MSKDTIKTKERKRRYMLQVKQSTWDRISRVADDYDLTPGGFINLVINRALDKEEQRRIDAAMECGNCARPEEAEV